MDSLAFSWMISNLRCFLAVCLFGASVVMAAAACSAGSTQSVAGDASPTMMEGGALQTLADGAVLQDDGSAVVSDAGPSCIRSSVTSSVRPLDLSIVIDNSGSLVMAPRLQVRNAYVSALTRHPLLGGATARLHAFPMVNVCDAPSYAMSLLTTPLPSSMIEPLIATLSQQGSSHILQGLSGAYLALTTAQMPSTNASAVVLVTDGTPATCPATTTTPQAWPMVQMAAADARAKNIKTYVVQLFADPAEVAAANTVAMAGGSGAARVVADVASVAVDVPLLAQALNADRGGIACSQAVPADFADAGDATLVSRLSVYVTLNGTRRKVPFDAACGGTEGWTLSPGGKSVVLCSGLCAALSPDKDGRFEVGVDCL
jgi:hypothetical protein